MAAGGFTKTPRLDLSALEAKQAPPITSRTLNYKIVERVGEIRQVMTPVKAKATLMQMTADAPERLDSATIRRSDDPVRQLTKNSNADRVNLPSIGAFYQY